eukprot:s49_g1.t1
MIIEPTVGRTEILRSFRILRLTRICRMAKLVRFFPELQILIKAMLTAFRSVFFALILLLASHYMIAIAYHVTLEETEVGKAAFGSVLASMQTLFVHCTMLDEIINLVDQFTTESLYAHLLCMYFVMFINAITLMNILIGIVVEVISNVAIAEREMVNVRWVQDVINQFLGNAEVLEQSELMEVLDQTSALQALKLLGVDVGILKEMVTAHFSLEEVPKDTDPQMPVADFVELVMQLRGANTATVKDVVDLRKWMDDSQQALALRLEFMVAKLREKRSLTGRRKKGQTASAQDGSEARGSAALFSDSDGDRPPRAKMAPQHLSAIAMATFKSLPSFEMVGPDRSAIFFDAVSTMQAEYDLVLAENRVLRQESQMRRGSPPEAAATIEVERSGERSVTQQDPLSPQNSGRAWSASISQDAEMEIVPKLRNSVFPSHQKVRDSIETTFEGRDDHHLLGLGMATWSAPGPKEGRFTRDSTCSRIALHPYFQTLDMVMICIYAVWMGIDADLNAAMLITDAQAVFQTADQVFCVYFVAELGIRYFAFEKCWDRLRDP